MRIPARAGTVGYASAPQARPPNPGASVIPIEAASMPGQSSSSNDEPYTPNASSVFVGGAIVVGIAYLIYKVT